MNNKEKNNSYDPSLNSMLTKERLNVNDNVKVECYPIYDRLKIDLLEKKNFLCEITDKFSMKEADSPQEIYSTLSYFLSSSKSTYLAPAYNLNNYLDNLHSYNLYIVNGGSRDEANLLKEKFGIDVHAIFYSIKCLLDRLVPILSFFYSGFSLSTTFGRISESGKAKGLMSRVLEIHKQDKIMNFILEEYHSWIQIAVGPRDLITHYNDLDLREHWTFDNRLVPIHLETKIFEDSDELFPNDFSYKSLSERVNDTYHFIDTILYNLLDRDIKLTKQHFKDKKEYELYKQKNIDL